MFTINDLLKHTNKTQRILSAMQLVGSGWTARQINEDTLAGPSVFLYLWDRPTQWTWMCSVPLDLFDRVVADVRTLLTEKEAIRNDLATLINKVAAGAPLDDALETELALLLSAYAGTTQVLGAARDTGMRELHFVVLNYRTQNLRDGKLRPFVLPSARAVLPGHELVARIQDVVSMDSARHPEWF